MATAAGVFLTPAAVALLFAQLFSQITQAVQGLEEGVLLLGEVEADEVVHRLPEEAGAGDGAHAHLPGQVLAEGEVAVIAKLRDVQQDVIGPLGVGVGSFKSSSPRRNRSRLRV